MQDKRSQAQGCQQMMNDQSGRTKHQGTTWVSATTSILMMAGCGGQGWGHGCGHNNHGHNKFYGWHQQNHFERWELTLNGHIYNLLAMKSLEHSKGNHKSCWMNLQETHDCVCTGHTSFGIQRDRQLWKVQFLVQNLLQ